MNSNNEIYNHLSNITSEFDKVLFEEFGIETSDENDEIRSEFLESFSYTNSKAAIDPDEETGTGTETEVEEDRGEYDNDAYREHSTHSLISSDNSSGFDDWNNNENVKNIIKPKRKKTIKKLNSTNYVNIEKNSKFKSLISNLTTILRQLKAIQNVKNIIKSKRKKSKKKLNNTNSSNNDINETSSEIKSPISNVEFHSYSESKNYYEHKNISTLATEYDNETTPQSPMRYGKIYQETPDTFSTLNPLHEVEKDIYPKRKITEQDIIIQELNNQIDITYTLSSSSHEENHIPFNTKLSESLNDSYSYINTIENYRIQVDIFPYIFLYTLSFLI